MNKNIKVTKRKFEIALIILIIFQFLFLSIVYIFLGKFSSEIGSSDTDFLLIRKEFLVIGLIIFIFIDIYFYIKFIYRISKLTNVEPRKCIIEDFIIYPYGVEKRNGITKKDYRISPLVKDLEDNELYFTYGNYSLSYYSFIKTSINNETSIKIYRRDGTRVEIGDIAFFYIRKKVNIDVDIDKSNNIIALNNKKMKYIHSNEKYDINIFNRINFFEGTIEVEDILKCM